MRLSESTLGSLDPRVQRPGYIRDEQKCGIVHFGLGAFHRGHQAVYTDDAMNAGDRDWGISGVSLRAPSVRDQLQPQDGLYSVTERSSQGISARLIASVRNVWLAPASPDAVIHTIAAPETKIASFTVTEKGYWQRPDGRLDLDAPDLASDLDENAVPRTLYGFLARGLAQRRARGLPGLTLLSCDNLDGNGVRLRRLLNEFLDRADPLLAAWFERHCTCPSTMVDRIVPAATPADRDAVARLLGVRDEGIVVTEPFRQWVIEDRFAGPRPRWELGGAQFVTDVAPYETAKLRLLNGAHSALAVLGLRRGHHHVHEAIEDPLIRPLVERLMRVEAAGSLEQTANFDVNAYADRSLARFANSALPHRLTQIATDGSQKVPQRWLRPLAINRKAGRDCSATLTALAAWLLHVRGDAHPVDDPMATQLSTLWRREGEAGIVAALFGEHGLFAAHWTASAADQAMVRESMRLLESWTRSMH